VLITSLLWKKTWTLNESRKFSNSFILKLGNTLNWRFFQPRIQKIIMKSTIEKPKLIDILLVVWQILFAAWPSTISLLKGIWKIQSRKTEEILYNTIIAGISTMRNFVITWKLHQFLLALLMISRTTSLIPFQFWWWTKWKKRWNKLPLCL
jgi:hypothetical protein